MQTMNMRAIAPARAVRQSATVPARALRMGAVRASRPAALRRFNVRAAAVDNETGIKKMRDGIKEAAEENALTPRFYTTDVRSSNPFIV